MGEEAPAAVYEDSFSSPADRIKDMILRRLEAVENRFDEMEDARFARTVLSLSRLFYIVASERDRAYLNEVTRRETVAVEERRKSIEDSAAEHGGNPDEAKDFVVQKIWREYAELRLSLLVEMLGHSPVIQKDVEVDFRVGDTMAEAQQISELIKTGRSDNTTQIH